MDWAQLYPFLNISIAIVDLSKSVISLLNNKLTSGGNIAAVFYKVAEIVDGTKFQTTPLIAVRVKRQVRQFVF
jgi:hypothetical protein